jgi:hypothetical protein
MSDQPQPTNFHVCTRGKAPKIAQHVIDQIKLNHKISDYLTERGVQPKTTDPSKLVYHCPLPTHPNDNSPSFYIYDKGDHEDYYCYGCKSGGSIVQFVAEYEGIGMRKAVERLSEGIGLDVSDIMDSLILEIIKESGNDVSSPKEGLELAFCLNKALHDYNQAVEFNPEDVAISEKVGRMIEKFLYAENIDELRKMFQQGNRESLDPLIRARVNLFNSRKEEEEIRRLRALDSGEEDAGTT